VNSGRNMIASRFRLRILLLLLCGFRLLAAADDGASWRVYRTTDGLAANSSAAVNFSPRGILWVRHGNGGPLSWLDGFQIHAVQDSSEGNFPVYESRSGQLWSLYLGGVMEYRRDQWMEHPLPSVRSEMQSSSVRLVRPIPLLPAERDHVLILLPEQLVKFDASQRLAVPLRHSGDSGIGRFDDLVEARDGGAWVTGSNGLAKIPTPLRRFAADSTWEEFLPNPAWKVRNLERPFEDDEGGVSIVADSVLSGGRVLLYFNGRTWEDPIAAPDRIRHAWRGVDQISWALTRNSLFKRESDRWEPVEIPGLRGAQPQFLDVAVQPNGIFWLATSEGLARYSPPTWRTPSGLAGGGSEITSILEDRQGRVWFATTNQLRVVRDGKWRSIPWPADAGTGPSPTESMHLLQSGSIAFRSGDHVVEFDPEPGRFAVWPQPAGKRLVTIPGTLMNGLLCVQTRDADERLLGSLETFDGRSFKQFAELDPKWALGTNLLFVQESEDRGVWVGGNDGIGFVDTRAESRGITRQLAAGGIRCLLEIARGKVWCGGDGGIYEFDGRAWSRLPMNAGRVQSMRKGLDGGVWIASSAGVLRYLDGSWVLNSTAEGLAGSIRDVWPDRRGNVWAGTSKGIQVYHPSVDSDPPACTLNDSSNRREVSPSDRVEMSFNGRDKWDQTPIHRLLFSHRLDERPWTPYTADFSVTYTNLLAGGHRFEVRAMDRNWNEQPQPLLFDFVAVTPWHREPRVLALTLAGIVLTVGLAALALNRHFRLMRSYAEVGRIVEQRTRELERANQELLHSQKMRALGTLAAGIAHDFNNILSIIKGSTQIIESNTGDPEKIKTRLDRIKTVVDQGSSIVKAMLGFSRTGGRVASECDLNQLVNETTRLLGDQFLKEISLRLELADTLPRVECAGELIQQILLNLIINAADSMDGHGEVVLRTAVLDELPAGLVLTPPPAQRFVSVSVEDTGSGISPDVLPRIFEPFFTTKALSTRRGTGLGLSMVYEIARELGCGIRVVSTPGKGSTFSIIVRAGAL